MSRKKKSNGADGSSSVKECVRRVEALLDKLAALKADYMAACKEVREDIKGSYDDARQLGVNTRAVKALIHTRILQARIDLAIDALDADQHDAFTSYNSLVSWGSTPLGGAARPTAEELEAQ